MIGVAPQSEGLSLGCGVEVDTAGASMAHDDGRESRSVEERRPGECLPGAQPQCLGGAISTDQGEGEIAVERVPRGSNRSSNRACRCPERSHWSRAHPKRRGELDGDGGSVPACNPTSPAGISGRDDAAKGAHARATGGAGNLAGAALQRSSPLGWAARPTRRLSRVSAGFSASRRRSRKRRTGDLAGGFAAEKAIPRAGARVTREGLGAGAITRSGSSRTLPQPTRSQLS